MQNAKCKFERLKTSAERLVLDLGFGVNRQ